MKIVIAGYGREGESSYRYYSKDPSNQIVIADQVHPAIDIPKGVETRVGKNAFSDLNGFDMVVRTAGLSPRKIHTSGLIWSQTNEFFDKCPAQIMGVTGTKGKGTTASLIAHILQKAGKKVWLLGNIGKPALDYLTEIGSNDIVVYELSSFQLWDIKKSPHYAVVLPISPEHLDVHDGFEDYLHAKSNICRFQSQTDIAIYHSDNEYSKQIGEVSSAEKKIRYASHDGSGAYERDGYFWYFEQKICSITELSLVGPHNVENACAAIAVCKEQGVEDGVIVQGLRDFEGLEHRLEFVREVEGVKYYNDSFSSSPAATIAAIRSFEAPKVMIIGGKDRGSSADAMVSEIAQSHSIRSLLLVGETKSQLAGMFRDAKVQCDIVISEATNMADIVGQAQHIARSQDVVILSPGYASFDMFKDFYDRGEKFKSEVQKL
jgi:UDP-N-acetylmuramoylalanine--D-glutamate ligase